MLIPEDHLDTPVGFDMAAVMGKKRAVAETGTGVCKSVVLWGYMDESQGARSWKATAVLVSRVLLAGLVSESFEKRLPPTELGS
jgi:hypothetical protein